MSAFFNRLGIYGDNRNGTRVYLDGAELKGCVEATLELAANQTPRLTVKIALDAVDVDLLQNGVVKDAEED